MRYYIFDTLRSALRRKYTYAYVAGIVVLCLLANIAIIGFRSFYGMNDGIYAYNLIQYAEGCFVIPFYSCIIIADIVFGSEYPNPLIKDKVTIGLSRVQIYLGKFIAGIIAGFIFALTAYVFFIGITFLLMSSDGSLGWWVVEEFAEKVLVASPLWLAGLSIGTMFLFVFRNKKKAYIAFYLCVLLLPRLIMFFAAEPYEVEICRMIREFLMTEQFNKLQFYVTVNEGRNLLLGVIHTVASCGIGIFVFQKREFQ